MRACPRCGEENPEGGRYCSACGSPLQTTASREERKVVSVLFVDLVGFTARSDRADPEDVRDLLRRYHARVREQIERFGGTVEKFIGDAVMAVFGAPVAHTDDAERAIRAGLRALEAVEGLNREQGDGALSARAAVNTGEAIVAIGSTPGQGEPLALGDVVNTASRLQTLAPPDRLVVGEETHRSTREVFRYEAMEPATAKGKAEPLAVWLVVEPVTGPAERRSRATPMVGRDRELSLLGSVWERAVAEGRPHLVTMLGPPGIGKSRLTREFGAAVEGAGGRVVRGRCLPYDTRDVFGAFAQQVKTVAGVFEGEAPESARGKLVRMAARYLPEAEPEELARYLSLILGLGLDEPVDRQALLWLAARRLVEGLGVEQPTLLVFEDIHWADAGLLDLIEYVSAHARDTSVVLVALARPELRETRPTWGAGVDAHTRLSLAPLPDGDAATVVQALIGEAMTADAAARLVEVADGNPLFLEELTAALLEGAEVGAELPTTVRAAIAARLDALPPDHRALLLSASVVGKSFWRGALKALGAGEDLDGVLDELEARELIRRERASQVLGDVEFSFRHILIRDVAYATLPRAERRAKHGSVAAYVAGVAGDASRELAWLLAYHWTEAGDTTKAIDYLLLAAARAQEVAAAREAMELLDRARDLSPDDGTRTRVRFVRALALVELGEYDEVADELEALLPSLEGSDVVRALIAQAAATHWTEQTERTIEVAGRALELAGSAGAEELVGPAMARLSQGYAMRGGEGDLDRALDLGEDALRRWAPGTRAGELAEHEHLLGDQHYWTGGYERALELSRAARDRAVHPSDAEALLRGGGMEGLLLTALGRYQEALTSFDRVIAVGRDLGRPVRVVLNYSSIAYRELYDLEEARRRSQEALDGSDRSSSFHMPWMNAVVDLLHADVLAGEFGRAMSGWDRIWEEVLATPAWERWYLGGKLAALRAEIALETEGPEAGGEWADRAIAMARTAGRVKYEATARTARGRALIGLGRADEALDELGAAAGLADRLGNPMGRWQAHAALGRAAEAVARDREAERSFARAAEVVRATATGLSPDRAERFLAAPQIVSILEATP